MTAGSYQHIRLELEGGVARLTLARPASLNALSPALMGELIAALDNLRDAGQARVLLLAGEGRGFSSGADLAGGGSGLGGDADVGAVLEQFYNPLIERMYALPIPIVAAVQGAVAGAGCGIALAADIVIAARSAYFLLAFVNLGLVPDAGCTWLLPRLVGRARAQAMMMLGERIPAETARDWGMIYEVVDDAALGERAEAIVAKLAAGPTQAYRLIRRNTRAALDQTLSESLVMERQAQREAGRTADFAEAVSAFVQKRQPTFQGR